MFCGQLEITQTLTHSVFPWCCVYEVQYQDRNSGFSGEELLLSS